MTAKSQTASAEVARKAPTLKKDSQAKKHIPGLFERWWALEVGKGLSTGQILSELNDQAGTSYKHNWPSVVAGRNYELERCPIAVRRVMMRAVLADELKKLGHELPPTELANLMNALT
jgi:hypothetical protein